MIYIVELSCKQRGLLLFSLLINLSIVFSINELVKSRKDLYKIHYNFQESKTFFGTTI